MRVELLFIDDCPNHEAVLPLLRRLINEVGVQVPITQQLITTSDEAHQSRFLGSPTIRVDGLDIEPIARERTDFGIQCRLYPTPMGPRGVPAETLIRAALTASRSTAQTS
jgi:hypothetical protein